MTSDLPRTFGPGATPIAPADREGARAALLQTFESVRDVIEETADETERGRTLAPRAVDAFRESGLFAFKVPREVGGAEADLVVQMDLIEAATLVDPAAAWSMLICSAVTGAATARVGDEALAEMYEGGRLPCMAGTLRPDGRATKVDGGDAVGVRPLGRDRGIDSRHEWVLTEVLVTVGVAVDRIVPDVRGLRGSPHQLVGNELGRTRGLGSDIVERVAHGRLGPQDQFPVGRGAADLEVAPHRTVFGGRVVVCRDVESVTHLLRGRYRANEHPYVIVRVVTPDTVLGDRRHTGIFGVESVPDNSDHAALVVRHVDDIVDLTRSLAGHEL